MRDHKIKKGKKSGLFGNMLAKVLGPTHSWTKDHNEKEAEKKVQHLILNAPKNRDVSKDRFLHKKVGRIPVFTLKQRKIPLNVLVN